MKTIRIVLVAGCCIGLAAGCVKKSSYDALQTQLTDTQKQLEDSQDQLSEEQGRMAVLQAKLGDTESKLSSAMLIPVAVGFRKALVGDDTGWVAVLTTQVKRELPVQVTLTSRAFGTTKTYQVIVPANGKKEIGHLEGFTIEEGDHVKVSSLDYGAKSYTFHAR